MEGASVMLMETKQQFQDPFLSRHGEATAVTSTKYKHNRVPPIPPPLPKGMKQKQQP